MTATTVLVLAGTGKTGARVAEALTRLGQEARTAARRSADVSFDWDDPSTHRPALTSVDRVYLVPPGASLDFAAQVSAFLDLAAEVGVRHITYLSARGIEHTPPEVAMRAVELDLAARHQYTHSILRPAWFMQNFSEGFLLPTIRAKGIIPVATGDGAEAFVDADDVAEVAAATLVRPEDHAGAAYTLTGPAALTMGEAARVIGRVAQIEVQHVDVDREEWIDQAVASGAPAAYARMLGGLADVIKSGAGAGSTGDVQRVTGRLPRSFEQFAEAASSTWQAERVAS